MASSAQAEPSSFPPPPAAPSSSSVAKSIAHLDAPAPLQPSESFNTLYDEWINPGVVAPGQANSSGSSSTDRHHGPPAQMPVAQPNSLGGPGSMASTSLETQSVDANLLASILNSQAHASASLGATDAQLPSAYAQGSSQVADFLAAVQNAQSEDAKLVQQQQYKTSPRASKRSKNPVSPLAPPPVPTTSAKQQTPRQAQADSTVPEAALHLLRLALPSGPGTATTVSSGEGLDEDASCDEDADGEVESDNTSLPSEPDPKKKHAMPSGLVAPRGKRFSGGRAALPSVAAPPAAPKPLKESASDRRTSGRVRKTILPDVNALVDSDDGGDDNSDEDLFEDDLEEEDDYEATHKGKGKGRAFSPALSSSAASSTKGSSSRRASTSSSTTASGNKRAKSGTPASAPKPKKPRTSNSGGPAPPRRPRRIAAPVNAPSRSFPLGLEMDAATFPRMYRQFPISSAFPPDSYVHRLRDLPGAPGQDVVAMEPPVDAKWNKASDPYNLYAPRFVKGLGDDKCGMCPICAESVERGGEGTERWLKLKNSSFVYHMSYAHGLSNLTGLPFSPPLKLRTHQLKAATKDARDHMTEGLCHKCNDWVPLLSVKNVDAVVPELIWWKHAKPCHGTSTIPGESDFYLLDNVFELVNSRKGNSFEDHDQDQYTTYAAGSMVGGNDHMTGIAGPSSGAHGLYLPYPTHASGSA